MKTIHWQDWGWQYGLPVLILGGLFALSFLMVADPDDAPMIWMFMAIPVVFLAGFVMRPRAVWVTPTAVTIVLWLIQGIAAARGVLELPAPWPVLILPFAFFVGFPMLLLTLTGRGLRSWLDRRLHRGTGGTVA